MPQRPKVSVNQLQKLTDRFDNLAREVRRKASLSRTMGPAKAQNRQRRPNKGNAVMNPPVAVASKTQGAYHVVVSTTDVVTRVRGRSFLGVVSSSASASNASGYDVGLVSSLHPGALGDRFSVMASTYDKYVYRSMKLVYVPACPTSTAGMVTIVLERDPNDPLVDVKSTSPLAQITSYEKASPSSVFMPASVTFSRDPTEKRTYFMDLGASSIDPREWEQARAIVYLSNVSNSTTFGMLYLDYDADLVAPSVVPTSQRNVVGPATQYQRLAVTIANPSATQGAFTITGLPSTLSESGRIIEMIPETDVFGTGVSAGINYLTYGGSAASVNPGQPFYAASNNPAGMTTAAGLFPSISNLIEGSLASNGFSSSATLAALFNVWTRVVGGLGTDFLNKAVGEL